MKENALSSVYAAGVELEQAVVDTIKKEIKDLPGFVYLGNKAEVLGDDSRDYLRVYALLELAFDITPPEHHSFVHDAIKEVVTSYAPLN